MELYTVVSSIGGSGGSAAAAAALVTDSQAAVVIDSFHGKPYGPSRALGSLALQSALPRPSSGASPAAAFGVAPSRGLTLWLHT